MLNPQEKAPNFTLNNQDGKAISLSDYLGKKVVLYFYPKDNTPGCTKQACVFKSAYDEFKKLGVEVIGISKDSENSHYNFAKKYNLPFTLLADPLHQVIEEYGAWQEKKLYGKSYMGINRMTYIIDEKGIIIKVMPKVKPDTNAKEILDFLANMRGE